MDQNADSKGQLPHKAHGGAERPFLPLAIKVLTVSDSRTLETDKSGAFLQTSCEGAGHKVLQREVHPDEASILQQKVRDWCSEEEVDVVLVTGGTGVTRRDVSPEAIEPLYDKPLHGFGELFRHLSYAEIGTSCIQSRASAGLVGRTLVFLMPGSTGACRLALEDIILPQLDARTRPCSFAELRDSL
ncbi:MAG: molybdenum cofactor biosynthesis protein B [Planctomycetota bacterium]